MNEFRIQLVKCYVFCVFGTILIGNKAQAQVYPPYDWLENGMYVAFDTDYEIRWIDRQLREGLMYMGPVESLGRGLAKTYSLQTTYTRFDFEDLVFVSEDTLRYVQRYMYDTELLLYQGEDSMLISIVHTPYSAYFLMVEFVPGHYQIDLSQTNSACDTTFGQYMIEIASRDDPGQFEQPLIRDLPADKTPAYIDYRYLKPCYEGIFPLKEVDASSYYAPYSEYKRMAWDITPRKWKKVKVGNQPLGLPPVGRS